MYTDQLIYNPQDLGNFLRFYKFLLSDNACKLIESHADLHEVLLRKSDEFIRDINTMQLWDAELKQTLITYAEAVKANTRNMNPYESGLKTKLIQII